MITQQSLRARANAIARSTLAPLPLAFWENAFPKDVIALCYHVVSDADLPHLQLYPYKNSEQFEADVVFARSRSLTYRQVADCRTLGTTLPNNGILFTFDDGLVQCYDVIRPILERHGVDAVFFVTTDYLDDRETFFECALSLCLTAIAALDEFRVEAVLDRLSSRSRFAGADPERDARARGRLAATRLQIGDDGERLRLFTYAFGLDESGDAITELCDALDIDAAAYARRTPTFMSSDEVRELGTSGFTIGAHGRKHRSLEHASAEDLEAEIVASCEAVAAITGQARVPFAFPYSGLGIDRTRLSDIVRRNPIVELIFDSGCLRNDPKFIVNRVFTDSPTFDTSVRSNVPSSLRSAWSVPSAWHRP